MKLCEWESYGWGEPTVHWFLGGKGLGIQQETSVWVGSTKSNHLIWAYLSFIQYNSYKLICLEVTLSTPIIPFNVGPKMCWLRRDYGRERIQTYFGVGDVGQDVSFLLCVFCRVFLHKEECHSTCAKSSVVESVWWVFNDFLNIIYQEETLKERLRYALNLTKMMTSNEQGTGKAVPSMWWDIS